MVITNKVFDNREWELSSKIALIRKRQTPIQSLTKDERIAMAERENSSYLFE